MCHSFFPHEITKICMHACAFRNCIEQLYEYLHTQQSHMGGSYHRKFYLQYRLKILLSLHQLSPATRSHPLNTPLACVMQLLDQLQKDVLINPGEGILIIQLGRLLYNIDKLKQYLQYLGGTRVVQPHHHDPFLFAKSVGARLRKMH